MKVKVGKRMVDVVDRACPQRSCFCLGFDKGVFVQGRGYVKYHDKPIAVCQTRHLNGCPSDSICSECRTLQIEGVKVCRSCGSKDIVAQKVKGDDN